MTDEPIDGEATEVEEAEVVEAEATGTSTALAPVRAAASREVLMPLDPDKVVEGMEAYQAMLPRLLNADDYQDAGGGRRFVKKSGWRKIARAFNLSVTIVSLAVERDEEGNPTRAECVARAEAPNGQVQDADGYCAAGERRFADQSGRQKLENDLRATATTRAKNRAIADLVGMGEVSAEEVEAGGGPPFGPAVSKGDATKTRKALEYLLPPDEAKAVWDATVEGAGGYLPAIAATAIRVAIKARKEVDDGAST